MDGASERALGSAGTSAGLERVIPAALLAGGALNGFAARVADAWSADGLAWPLPGLGPIELVCIAVAAHLVARAVAGRGPNLGVAELAFLALLLVPSSSVSWAATAGYAVVVAARTSGESRAGALLFLALAAVALWSSNGLKLLAVPVTSAEAWLTGQVIGLVRDDVVQAGNVVGVPGGHSLVILAACSALDGLPRVLIGAAAIALGLGGWTARRLALSCLACAVVYLCLNEGRLVLMAWSVPFYEMVHGPTGAGVFDLLQSLMALATAAVAVRR